LGDGDDTFTVASASLNSDDTVTGGAGTDSLIMSNGFTVIDSDFTNVTTVETFSYGTQTGALTLGAQAVEAGIVTVTDGTGDLTATVVAGYTGTLTVGLSTGDDSITATAQTSGTTTVSADIDSLSASDTITGVDTLSLTLDGTNDNATATQMSTVTSVTQFTIATDDDVSLTLSNNNTAASATLTIDATAVTTQAATINGAAEADGNLVITAAGAGAHIITLGSGNDSYTSTSTGVDTVIATAGTNTISVGGGIDVVTSGTGVDTVTLGTDDAADRYIMNNLTQADTITDFDLLKADGSTAEDQLELTLLSVEAMVSGTGDLVLAGVSTTSVATNTTMVVADVTGALDLGTVATAMVLNVTGTYAATTDVETALELGGARQLTANGLFAADDAILLSYSNGTDMKVAVAEITGAVADDAIFGPGVLTITDLITLSGITDVSVAIAGNYDIV
jgi:hypothetical protein